MIFLKFVESEFLSLLNSLHCESAQAYYNRAVALQLGSKPEEARDEKLSSVQIERRKHEIKVIEKLLESVTGKHILGLTLQQLLFCCTFR